LEAGGWSVSDAIQQKNAFMDIGHPVFSVQFIENIVNEIIISVQFR